MARQYTDKMKTEYKKRTQEWRKNNPEKRAKQAKASNDKARFSKYGIDEEHYLHLFNQQEGRCAICHTHQQNLKRSLAIDHCHTKGHVRGLLCTSCNTMLGLAKDNTDILLSAILYLRNE
jgi:hypothetical protein